MIVSRTNFAKEISAEGSREKVVDIPLAELHPFKDHPFKVKDDDAMMDTAESIKQYGVLVPAIARPDPEGGYELVAGHRRHHASELAGKDTMPVIVRDLDDDAATIIMVDTNLQREELLPSSIRIELSTGRSETLSGTEISLTVMAAMCAIQRKNYLIRCLMIILQYSCRNV